MVEQVRIELTLRKATVLQTVEHPLFIYSIGWAKRNRTFVSSNVALALYLLSYRPGGK
jgi:hypothetical protein